MRNTCAHEPWRSGPRPTSRRDRGWVIEEGFSDAASLAQEMSDYLDELEAHYTKLLQISTQLQQGMAGEREMNALLEIKMAITEIDEDRAEVDKLVSEANLDTQEGRDTLRRFLCIRKTRKGFSQIASKLSAMRGEHFKQDRDIN